MSKFSIEVEGLAELKVKFKDLDKEAKKRVNKAINLNATEFQREVRKTITKRTGRHERYRRGRKWHWSSKPGRPPNTDTGNLRKNIRVTQRANMSSGLAVVISEAKYSAALEYGHKQRGRRGGRVAARPFMGPMLRKKRRLFVRRIQQAIKGAL